MVDLQRRVSALLARRGITQAEATRRGGFKNPAFINDIVRGHKSSVRGNNLRQLAAAFSTTELYLLGKTDDPDEGMNHATPLGTSIPSDTDDLPITNDTISHIFPRDVPIRGTWISGIEAEFTVDGITGDFAYRLPGLIGKHHIYGIHVIGDTMYPAMREGELIYIDPTRLPTIGEDGVIELRPREQRDGVVRRSIIKRLKRRAPSVIIVEQFMPPLDLELDVGEIESIHRVIPWGEVIG